MWASATTLSPTWLLEHCNISCESCTVVDLSNKTAPRSCFKLVFVPARDTLVLKQLPSDEDGEPLPHRLTVMAVAQGCLLLRLRSP
jgi:hypothetical protein